MPGLYLAMSCRAAAPAAEWQNSSRFCCLGPGKHVAVIRVLGQNNAHSTGQFVDLDGFRVE
jgi:hypothetical protein